MRNALDAVMVERERLLDYQVTVSDESLISTDIVNGIRNGRVFRWLACINPHSYVVARKCSEFSDALRFSDWLVPDGFGIVLASWLLGGRIRRRVTGSDIFLAVNDALNQRGGGRVFFMGGTVDVLEKISERMKYDFPNLEVVGLFSPPFKDEYDEDEVEDMLQLINAASPDVLWVGMTSPKQDLWLYRHRKRLEVPFAAGVGAVFDFYAGTVKRSHPIFQGLGLEWLPRLLQEPRRLWRRTLISAPAFMWRVVKEKISIRRVC